MNRLTVMCFCFLGMLLPNPVTADTNDNISHSLVPAPLFLRTTAEGFTPGKQVGISIVDSGSVQDPATWMASLMSARGSRFSVTETDSADLGIRLKRISREALAESFQSAGQPIPAHISEAYSLAIGPDGVAIHATTEAGLFYGLVSLWQLVEALPQDATWPGLVMLDAPEFEWRGLMLDSARHMQSPEFIKRYIDWMALHKLNVFHWHLTDDQAWRLEIKSWPKLTQVGGYRVPAGEGPAAEIDPETGEPRLYGGYYSQDEIRDVVAHAASRHVMVVPEIDVPGHATAAIAAYPELGVPGHGIDRVPASWGIYHNVFNLEESTFRFLEDVLGEIVTLFPGPFIHLGGDEVETAQWENSERIRDRMKELGIEDIQGVQNYYVERLQKFLDPYDRRVIGWDEILQSKLPPHAAVMSWRGVDGAIEAAGKGHQAVLSPAPILYLDHLQTAAADAPPGRGGVMTTRDIYHFDPLPGSLQANRDLVLGIQGNLWTEHVRTEQRAAYMTWPRAAAIAELGWTPARLRSWDRFAAGLPVHLKRLDRLGIPAAKDRQALYGNGSDLLVPPEGDRREDRELELCGQSIVLALDDDAPAQGERASFLVDVMNPCWIWRGADLRNLGSISAAVGQLPFNFEIGDMVNDVVVEQPGTAGPALRARLGSCDGPVVAELPLVPAIGNHAVTELPPASLELPSDAPESADLCFSFTRTDIEPIWVLDWVDLGRATP